MSNNANYGKLILHLVTSKLTNIEENPLLSNYESEYYLLEKNLIKTQFIKSTKSRCLYEETTYHILTNGDILNQPGNLKLWT